eukprot:7068659-Ditylum_brightwellii.AAC.1
MSSHKKNAFVLEEGTYNNVKHAVHFSFKLVGFEVLGRVEDAWILLMLTVSCLAEFGKGGSEETLNVPLSSSKMFHCCYEELLLLLQGIYAPAWTGVENACAL